MGAMVVGATTSLQSCKDYDDDIQNLQQQIDANSKAIKAIEDLIKNGSVITNVAEADNGVIVTLSDGKKFTIANGEDGTPGTAWTIGTDGYWYKDGKKTEFYALGTKGDKGDKGDQGEKGDKGDKGDAGSNGNDGTSTTTSYEYYVPNAETGCFDIWKDGKFVKSTTISFRNEAQNGISAVLDKENLTLTGVEGVAGKTVVISLSGALKSLVFMPHLYLDGIEAYEYKWLQDTVQTGISEDHSCDFHLNLQGKEVATNAGTPKTVRLSAATNENKPYDYDYSVKLFSVSPVWGVQYHMNPSNANTKAEDVKGYNVLNPAAIYTTRAAEAKADVKFAAKDLAGNDAFFNANGILTAGIKVTNPASVHVTPTDKYANDMTDVNTFALQVESKYEDVGDPIVTSDYSMLVPTRGYLKALVWSDDQSHNPGGENCPAVSKNVHIYDSPDKALKNAPALEMSYESANGIDLSQYVAIEYMQQNIKNKYNYERGVWAYGEQLPYGLKYEFNLVYYRVDGNQSVDSRYTKWVDKSKGQIRAWNVDKDGVTPDGESATSIGREPLVQVLVKNAEGEVVLDGYILIKITDKPAADQPNSTVDLGTKDAGKFDLCNGKDVFSMNWSEFSKIILTDHMENMTKEKFEELYALDVKRTAAPNGDGNAQFYANVYTQDKATGYLAPETNQLGEVLYTSNVQNTTNDAFVWTLTEAELEELTHHTSAPVTVTRYIRYNRIKADVQAKYPYIYVKMTFTVGRNNVATTYWGAKNDNYWFAENGATNGWEAVQFDIKEPVDGQTISTYNRGVGESLLSLNTGVNKEWFFTGAGSDTRLTTQPAHKYYLVPKDINIVGQDGKTYTITANNGTNTTYDKLVCKYKSTDTHNFFANGVSQLNTVLNSCAINYDAGAFNNTNLYAKQGANYVQIATLNATTGVITLDNNETTRTVLNAIGYMQNRENLNKEFRTYVGLVASNGCGVAEIVEDKDHANLDGTFLASWTRPINVLPHGSQQAVDANTNGNTIYVLDFLKMYDWRGYDGTEAAPDFSKTDANMWGDNYWFWVYYGIKEIDVDLTPANVETTMHSGSWKKLSEITTRAELVNVQGGQNNKETYNFWSLINSFKKASDNAALVRTMQANKKDFGAFVYYNNGDIVESFKVRIPITIRYTWGEFKTKVEVQIKSTMGHDGH